MIEKEPEAVQETAPSAENVGQVQTQSDAPLADENKPAESDAAKVDEAPAEKPVEGDGEFKLNEKFEGKVF